MNKPLTLLKNAGQLIRRHCVRGCLVVYLSALKHACACTKPAKAHYASLTVMHLQRHLA